jgi:hypothetical protein
LAGPGGGERILDGGARMFESMGIADHARVFQCPVCKETIDTSAQKCRFCSATIDAGAAEAAADAMAKINQACSDASYLKVMTVSILVFFGLMFVPFAGLLGLAGYYFLAFAVPVMTIRWWVKFGSIQTNETDFRSARGMVILVSVLGSIPIILILINFFVRIFASN